MSDEQTIYIGPEDDLTTVRERLERISSRRVTLVIPTQTQLRSHVAWKLLHARARELGKDVLIVSSDPQIRSVAQAVKFKVAYSMEAASSNRLRGGSRPTRNPAGRGKTTSSSRTISGRGSSEGTAQRGKRPAGALSPQPEQLPASWPPVPQEEVKGSQGSRSKQSQAEEKVTGGLEPLSSTFDLSEQQYHQPYDYRHIDTTPSIHPLSPEQIDEDADHVFLQEDVDVARQIREAALEGSKQEARGVEPPFSPEKPHTPGGFSSFRAVPLPDPVEDALGHLEDSQPPPRKREQRGYVSLRDIETTSKHPVQEGSNLPSSVVDNEIEDIGDQDAPEFYAGAPPITPPWAERSRIEEPRTGGSVSGRTSRTERAIPSRQQDLESEDALAPIEDRPTVVTPPVRPSAPLRPQAAPQRPAASVGQGRQVSVPAATASARTTASRPLQRPASRGRPALSRPNVRSTRPGGAPRTPARASRRSSTGGYLFGVIVVVFLLLVGALAYFVPSARVTVTLPSRDYTHAVKLTARPGAQPRTGALVAAETLTKTFTRSGTGSATGSQKIDNQVASGSVLFTNTGSALVTIPSGTVVATEGANGQQFITTANAVVSPAGSDVGNTTQVPIQAQKPGAASNTARGTITVIPDSSLSQIAKASKLEVTALKLQITNSEPTKGGGAGTVRVVSRKDLENAQKALQGALNGEITNWLNQQKTSNQDILGKPSITASLVNPPREGQVANNETFPVQLKATVNALLVRGAAVQEATVRQLNEFLLKEKNYNGYIVDATARQAVKIPTPKVSGDDRALTLDFTATAKAVPHLTQDQVRQVIVGKSIGEAKQRLKTLPNAHVQDVKVETTPGFVSWIPFWSNNIAVDIVPGTTLQEPKPDSKK
jgi:hypothetical protein